ncbi:snare complex subunit [Niveomyces insectorum RCEF 264]|uniref:Snare complex subunit n=1 Tax=Niveomyces insectorum RCEF 264 TaxID=1081102 RepID=A0A167QTZ3_9HYPO|nr:snare complex subunit [Niveomyces insectorum RCEF 264]
MSNANALYLLADHIKLSLLERQRAKALDLLQEDNDAAAASKRQRRNDDNGGDDDDAKSNSSSGRNRDAQDGHISRSLDQFQAGLEALERERTRLEGEGEEGKALNIADALPGLQKKYADLTAQFHGLAPTAVASSPSPLSSSSSSAPAAGAAATKPAKAVRFQDKPLPRPGGNSRLDPDLEAQRAGLFNRPYTDEPDDEATASSARYGDHDNVQLHQLHARIMADQDTQLDALGESIGRQRELSMQIGEELDGHVVLLEEADRLTEQHQTRLDRARRQVGKVARSAGECKQMVTIVVLIVILVLLIAVLK